MIVYNNPVLNLVDKKDMTQTSHPPVAASLSSFFQIEFTRTPRDERILKPRPFPQQQHQQPNNQAQQILTHLIRLQIQPCCWARDCDTTAILCDVISTVIRAAILIFDIFSICSSKTAFQSERFQRSLLTNQLIPTNSFAFLMT